MVLRLQGLRRRGEEVIWVLVWLDELVPKLWCGMMRGHHRDFRTARCVWCSKKMD